MELHEIRHLARMIVEEMDMKTSAELAPKWEDGTIIFKPEDESLKAHEIPVSVLLHKIVMMRNNLRVLEQQVNSTKTLSDGEKVKLQGYITKVYGSMTSFNFMFYNDKDKFSSR